MFAVEFGVEKLWYGINSYARPRIRDSRRGRWCGEETVGGVGGWEMDGEGTGMLLCSAGWFALNQKGNGGPCT